MPQLARCNRRSFAKDGPREIARDKGGGVEGDGETGMFVNGSNARCHLHCCMCFL